MMKLRLFLISMVLVFATGAIFGQPTIAEVIEAIKNADSIADIFGLFTVLTAFVTYISVEVAKVIPVVAEIKGKYLTILVLAAITVIAGMKYGASVLYSVPFVWVLITNVYDKFFKPEPKAV